MTLAAVAQVPPSAPDPFVESIEFKNCKFETLPDGSRQGSFQPKYAIKNGGNAKSGEFRFTWEHWDNRTGKWAFWLYPPPLTWDKQVAERNEQNNEKTREARPIAAGMKPATPAIPELNEKEPGTDLSGAGAAAHRAGASSPLAPCVREPPPRPRHETCRRRA